MQIKYFTLIGCFLFLLGCPSVDEGEVTSSSLKEDLKIKVSGYSLKKSVSNFAIGGECIIKGAEDHSITILIYNGSHTGSARTPLKKVSNVKCVKGTFSGNILGLGLSSLTKLAVIAELEGSKKRDTATVTSGEVTFPVN